MTVALNPYDHRRQAELEDRNWTSPRYAEFLVPAHVQDIAENACDPVHLQYVHRKPDVPPSEVSIEDSGRSTAMLAKPLFPVSCTLPCSAPALTGDT